MLSKVENWLDTEGYPTEFRVASTFRKHGFHVDQGDYAEDRVTGSRREIDIAASLTMKGEHSLQRVYNIVECKWSQDKPWVVFTSPTCSMAPSAIIAQTIASHLAAAVFWTLAGDTDLNQLSLFQSQPGGGGFGGRQAFSKGNDIFYTAMQGVVGNSQSNLGYTDAKAGCWHDYDVEMKTRSY
jgi:hypothetical protein